MAGRRPQHEKRKALQHSNLQRRTQELHRQTTRSDGDENHDHRDSKVLPHQHEGHRAEDVVNQLLLRAAENSNKIHAKMI
jgi:hypothetical protein